MDDERIEGAKLLIQEYLDKHHSIKDFKDTINLELQPLIIELSRLIEINPAIGKAIVKYLKTDFKAADAMIIDAVAEWSDDVIREVHYSIGGNDNDDSLFEFTSFSDFNHTNKNKLIRIKGTVESYSSPVSVPILFLFLCPNCGSEYKYIKETYPRCQCGTQKLRPIDKVLISRYYFSILEKNLKKEISEMGLAVAQCYFEIKGQRMPDDPLFTRALAGKEIDALVVLRMVEVIGKAGKQIIWHLELKGVKLLDERIISPERQQEIIETIRKDSKALHNLAVSMRHNVAYQEQYSLLTLMAAVGLHKGDADLEGINGAFNILFVGDPSLGKSFITKQILKYIPRGFFQVGRSTSSAYLGGTPISGKGEFEVKYGIFSLADDGYIIVDELDKLQKFKEDVMASIYTALSDGEHTLDTAYAKLHFRYRTNFIGLANYKNITSDREQKSLYSQIDIDTGILRRMDAVVIFKSPYRDETGTIEKEKHNYFLAVQSGRIKPSKPYDDEFCKDYGIIVTKFKQGPFTEKARETIENIARRRVEDLCNITDECAQLNADKKPIDDRFPNTLKRGAKIISRLLFANETNERHVQMFDDLLELVQFKELMQLGITSKVGLEIVMDRDNTARHRRMNKIDAILAVLYNSPKETFTYEILYDKVREYFETEMEFERILQGLVSKGDVYSPRPDLYMKQG